MGQNGSVPSVNEEDSFKYTPDQIKLTIRGTEHIILTKTLTPDMSLNEYLRTTLYTTGTKKMCLEGGCGACIVVVQKPNPITGKYKLVAVNSCLVSILTCNNWKIETIESIGGPLTKYHPVQQALANFNGTQCGFCSPGMVMNMYALYETGKLTMKEVENSFGGNICRCTGYRPILTAFKSLCSDATSELSETYPDLEDLGCNRSKCESSCKKICENRGPLYYSMEGAQWIQVSSIKDLLAQLNKLKDEKYMLIAGNTGQGVYKEPPSDVYIDVVLVKELIMSDVQNDQITLGANMSLTHAMNLMYKISKKNQNFTYLKQMADHIDLIANVPVRNMGTLAGNLMLKHAHNEFPSDVFLIFETFGAKLTLVDSTGQEIQRTPSKFLLEDMRKRVLKNITLSSLSKDYKYVTYKIMPRAQNAHALVNAGFLFKFDSDNLVEKATIVYGNINPKFIHATTTEAFLTGKDIFDDKVLKEALSSLSLELICDKVLPEPEPEFRKELAIALFYKAVLTIAPDDKVSPSFKSGGSLLERPVSSGIQDYETKKSLYPLTQAIPKVEALAQTSGQAEYIDDIPPMPHQLYAKFVRAQAPPNSRIEKVDVSKALAVKGVVAFYDKKDIPGSNNFIPTELGFGIVEKIFCDEIVEYYDQPVGILVGQTIKSLEEAVDLVDITYALPNKDPLLTIKDILKSKADSKLSMDKEVKPKKTGTDIAKVIKGSFEIGSQYHFHMETQCCLTVPTEDGLDVYPSTQWIDLNQIAIARMLKISNNKINISVRRCGGGFGGKISRNSLIACAVSLAAWKLRKPVRMALTLKENMQMIGKRFPFYCDYEVGVNSLGKFQYLKAKMYSDHGVGGNEKVNYMNVFDLLQSTYDDCCFDLVYYTANTDTHANTWTRAPGSTEGLALIESIIEHIACETNLSPMDVRMQNLPQNSQSAKYLADFLDWAEVDKREKDIIEFNKANRWKKKGISIVPMTYPFAPFGPISVQVSIFHGDGSVCITHGGVEIGQGINTKAIQVCASRFGIPIEKVSVRPNNSAVVPNSTATGGSMTSEAVCYGVMNACDKLLRRMEPFKNSNAVEWEKLVQICYAKFVSLSAKAMYSPTAPFVSPYLIYGTCAAEVIVDILTGQYLITRVDLLEDVGTSLNPYVDIGQVEGAFIYGVGYFTSEKIVMDQDGQILTNNTWFYKPPGAKDIPIDFRVKFPKNNANPKGVLQSKATGEPPLCMAVTVPLAIRNAVSYARTEANPDKSKWYSFEGPSTVENTFMNCLNNISLYNF